MRSYSEPGMRDTEPAACAERYGVCLVRILISRCASRRQLSGFESRPHRDPRPPEAYERQAGRKKPSKRESVHTTSQASPASIINGDGGWKKAPTSCAVRMREVRVGLVRCTPFRARRQFAPLMRAKTGRSVALFVEASFQTVAAPMATMECIAAIFTV